MGRIKRKRMKIGITGTREGMTEYQERELRHALEGVQLFAGDKAEFHHGDCRGVDVQAAAIAKELGFKIVCHPPVSAEEQGHFGGDEVREAKGYLERDRNIVDECEFLFVVPKQMEWQPKGGTWYTHDYAKKKGVTLAVFWPEHNVDD
jgi:hypothetical protein